MSFDRSATVEDSFVVLQVIELEVWIIEFGVCRDISHGLRPCLVSD